MEAASANVKVCPVLWLRVNEDALVALEVAGDVKLETNVPSAPNAVETLVPVEVLDPPPLLAPEDEPPHALMSELIMVIAAKVFINRNTIKSSG